MSSRMDRYNNEVEENVSSRVNKNTSLYEDIKRSSFTRVSNNDNIRVIESSGKTIDINKIKKYILENKEEPRVRKIITVPEEKVETNNVPEEKKVYDINSVLEKARKSRELDYENERHKKISEQGYNVLNKLKEYEKEEESYEEDELNTEERTLVDLINTVTVHKGEVNLLEELMSTDKDEEVTSPIKEEQEKSSILKEIQSKKLEEEKEKTQELVNLKKKINDIYKSFYNNSMSFSKEDFEGFEELEKSVKKSGRFATIGIVLLCLASLATLVVIANYIFELGLF